MRSRFVRALVTVAARDPRVLLLTGDLGYTVVEPFADRFPHRFFNVGVAEQNIVGLAAGLADAGFFPFVYSIATFASLRPYEFIRNDAVLQRLPVRIAAVGTGFEYGSAGPSHHALEDVGALRMQPGLTVICPADDAQAESALLATWDLSGPVYYRLSKSERAPIPGLDGRFELGRLQWVRQGRDMIAIASGPITVEAAAAVEELARRDVSCALAVVASLNPAPVDDLVEAIARFPVAMSVEAHYASGGLGSLISEVIAERGLRCRVVRCGVRTVPDGASGSERYLNRVHGLDREVLVTTALSALATVER